MTALATFFSHPLSLAERFAVAVDQIKSQERPMTDALPVVAEVERRCER